MLTASRHGYPDPAASPDPVVRRLVSVLGTVQIAPPPTPEFTRDLRAQLVAVAPRLVAEGPEDAEPRPSLTLLEPPPVHRRAARWTRVAGFAVSALTVVVLLLGGLVWISRSALPGDALYGLKRTAETFQLALTSSSEAKGRLELHFAEVRTNEVAKLIARPSALGAGVQADASISATTASLVRSTLTAADADVVAATTLLTDAAMQSHDTAPLKILAQWAPTQRERLFQIADRLPPGPLRSRALLSVTVVKTAQQQAAQVSRQVRCTCRKTTETPGPSSTPVPCTPCPATSGSTSSAGAASSAAQSATPAASSSVPAAPPAATTSQAPYQPAPPAGAASTTDGNGQDGGAETPSAPPSDTDSPVPSSSSEPSSDPSTLPSTDPSSLVPSSSPSSLPAPSSSASQSGDPIPSHPHPSHSHGPHLRPVQLSPSLAAASGCVLQAEAGQGSC